MESIKRNGKPHARPTFLISVVLSDLHQFQERTLQKRGGHVWTRPLCLSSPVTARYSDV